MILTGCRKIQIVPITIFCFLLTACSFTKIIFVPDKVPPTVKELINKTLSDTITVNLNKRSNKIYFVKNRKDTIDLGYTIENVFFKSKNGDTLNGWFLKPKNQTAKITLLHFHGNGG